MPYKRIASGVSLFLVATVAFGASYKCKDASGNWSEAACTGNAAPPPKPVPFDWSWTPKVGMHAEEVEAVIQRAEAEDAKLSSADRILGKTGHPYNEWLRWPEKKNRTESARGTREQWVFRILNSTRYLYFDNGILTAIQD